MACDMSAMHLVHGNVHTCVIHASANAANYGMYQLNLIRAMLQAIAACHVNRIGQHAVAAYVIARAAN